MTDDELDDIEKEMNEIHENFKRSEIEGTQNILRYFDRIHDKLFTFNNILIAGYFALSQIFESFSIYGIIVPLINLALLIIIEYRMMEKSRFDSQVTKKTKSDINENGLRINRTTRYSLYSIISTTIVVGIFIYNLFNLDSKAAQIVDKVELNIKEKQIDSLDKLPIESSIIGVWTDFETENASLSFENDSIYYLDSNTTISYLLKTDTLIRFFQEIIDTSKIVEISKDTLIIESKYGKENYGRFKN
ncbi:hypothetical protein [Marinifilum flexuosum]|uniref:hypothetical protein n=1 Tax=Marinifilum flexuosum TaxID=1117708 RepID=UPI00248F8939|nr:hypothetical protein [Marinifilum flexuosum]